MNNVTYKANQKAFTKLKDDGASPDALKGYLYENGVPFSMIAKVYKEFGGPNGKRVGFRAEFYNWLKEGARTMDEVAEKVKEGSANDVKHLSHYQGIAELTNAIHAGK